jgi:ring-1,2-phenylacetyl-CoA epoxidase subunit PaaE
MNSLYKRLRIKKIKEEVKGFKTFVFEDGHGIQYKAGQYLTLVKEHKGEEIRRSYSITSAPSLNESLSIGVKRIENGFFSRLLIDEAKVGDELITTGAGGFFVLPNDIQHYQQFFFFAAGSGITPIYSLIKEVLFSYPHLLIILIYSNASESKAVFLNELKLLQQQFASRFSIDVLFSNNADLFRARLHRDLLMQLVEQNQSTNSLYYVCGPESYMRLCTYTLQEMGIDKNSIKKEDFVINKAIKKDAAPPDTTLHVAHIKFGEDDFEIEVNYPDSILKAAKKQGIGLPYSCEAGRCGNCVAKCIKGTVWHSYNEVLTDKELEQGLILTCVGHPIHGDVYLEIK